VAISPPEGANVPVGGDVSLRCEARGSGMTIDWKRRDGRNLPPGASYADGLLIIRGVREEDAGVYICSAVDSFGGVGEAYATITVLRGGVGGAEVGPRRPEPPRPQPPGAGVTLSASGEERQTLPQGSTAIFRCSVAGGRGGETVSWTRVGDDNFPASEAPRVTVSDGTLTISPLEVDDRGVYVCTLDGSGGFQR